MPTILTHAVVPLAIGLGLSQSVISRRLLACGIAASMLPDLDVIAFRLNIAYADTFGHRGVSHSICFALLIGLIAMLFSRRLKSSPLIAFAFVAVATASHGMLDMFTNGGYGVAFWWPFSAERIFAPWQVIEVSPLSLRRVFSERGFNVLVSEVVWVWLPAIGSYFVMRFLHRHFSSKAASVDA
ncbi:metal-dependent hydrolase [Undibacterium flavidum]|uniref:Metal-dependent hydrolase n=1 Tax=Undibacterium flavidum TaxID=2762297 RepID=A0ABR6Y797_9BURK|nr:metal-dependent hydrolase [Undibacterium flavidum]MBC3872494.1 metal-dependent hydrolase [Undibacterium flavidum]